jgi:PQ loop repeat
VFLASLMGNCVNGHKKPAVRVREEATPVMVEFLAWTGAFLSCLLTIPQAVRTLRSDRLDGLSATTYWIVFANAVVWASWSAFSAEYAAGVPSLVNGPAALLILRRLHRSQREAERVPHLDGSPSELTVPAQPAPGLVVNACT